jgi:hypothetical protein
MTAADEADATRSHAENHSHHSAPIGQAASATRCQALGSSRPSRLWARGRLQSTSAVQQGVGVCDAGHQGGRIVNRHRRAGCVSCGRLESTKYVLHGVGVCDTGHQGGRIAVQAASRVADFNPQNMPNTAWAFATLGIKVDALFTAIAVQDASCVADFKQKELSNTAWSFATLGIKVGALFTAIAVQAASCVADFNPQQLSQLYQVHLWLRDSEHALPIPATMVEDWRTHFSSSDYRIPDLQRSVYRTLDELGVVYAAEYLTPDGLWVDAVLANSRVAIEVNGPSHYASNSRSPLGHTLLKYEHVLVVPYREWNQRSRDDRRSYLRAKFNVNLNGLLRDAGYLNEETFGVIIRSAD